MLWLAIVIGIILGTFLGLLASRIEHGSWR